MAVLFKALQLNRFAQLRVRLELCCRHDLARSAAFGGDRFLPEGQTDQPGVFSFAQRRPTDGLRFVFDVGIDEKACQSAPMLGGADYKYRAIRVLCEVRI